MNIIKYILFLFLIQFPYLAAQDEIDTTGLEIRESIYTPEQLESFLDSIGGLPSTDFLKDVWQYPDSIFINRTDLTRSLSQEDILLLKEFCKKEKMEFGFLKRVFYDYIIDSVYLEMDSLPMKFYSFDNMPGEFKHYAICLGDDFTWNSDVYFFSSNKIISRHLIYHRYGLDLNHYMDTDSNIVIYYRENFHSGTGIWWFNYNFYKYNGEKIIPILNELENSNLQYPWHIRAYWLESFIEQTNPLQIKMVYYVEIPDSNNDLWRIIDDSTVIHYNWEEGLKRLVPDLTNSNLTREQIFSYYLDNNELLFINSYYHILKESLYQGNEKKIQAIFLYLSEVKRHYDQG